MIEVGPLQSSEIIPPFENRKGWGSLKLGDTKAGPTRRCKTLNFYNHRGEIAYQNESEMKWVLGLIRFSALPFALSMVVPPSVCLRLDRIHFPTEAGSQE